MENALWIKIWDYFFQLFKVRAPSKVVWGMGRKQQDESFNSISFVILFALP